MLETIPASTDAPRGVSSEKLLEIAGRAKSFTGSLGAAIALSVGDQFITCAACGISPKQGAALSVQRNFTQLCPPNNKVLCSNDIDSDSRIDARPYRALKIKSLVIVPLGDPQSVAGVLAVFSGVVNAFTGTHVAMLKTLAEVASHMLAPEQVPAVIDHPVVAPPTGFSLKAEVATASVTRAAERSSSLPINASSPTTVSKSSSGVATAPPIAVVNSSLTPRLGKIAPGAHSSTASTKAPTPHATRAPASPPPPAPKTGTVHILDLASDPLCDLKSNPATPAGLDKKTAADATSPQASSNLRRPPSRKRRRIVRPTALAVLVLLAVGWLAREHRRNESLQRRPQTTLNAAIQPVNLELQVPQAATSLVIPKTNNLVSTAEAAAVTAAAPAQNKNLAIKAWNELETSEVPPPSQPVVIVHTGSSAASLLADSREAVPHPDLNIAPKPTALKDFVAASGSALPAFRTPKIEPSRVVFKVAPIYPAEARLRGIAGTVVLSATVTKSGSVANVRALSGAPSLCNAAMEALKKWRYRPALMNGSPVDSTVEVVFHFRAS